MSAVTQPPSPRSTPALPHLAQTRQIKRLSTAPSLNSAPTPAHPSPTHKRPHSPRHLVVHSGPQPVEAGDLVQTGTALLGQHGLVRYLPPSALHLQVGDQEIPGVEVGEDTHGADPAVLVVPETVVLGVVPGERKLVALLALVPLRGRLGLLVGDLSRLGLVCGLVALARLLRLRLLLLQLLSRLMVRPRSSLVLLLVSRLCRLVRGVRRVVPLQGTVLAHSTLVRCLPCRVSSLGRSLRLWSLCKVVV